MMTEPGLRERKPLLARLTGRFAVLFWLLVAGIALPVVVPDGPLIRMVMGVALFVLMLSGLHAISERRRQLAIGIALAVPAVALNLIGLVSDDLQLYVVSQYVYLAFFIYLAVHMLRWTLHQHEIDLETIYAAVSVYLLAALIWGIAHYTLAITDPGSFHFPDDGEIGKVQAERALALETGEEPPPMPDWQVLANSASGTMMYYSFVTLTTLGYGDIYPTRDVSRILAMLEATLGQLYLVILVARLVGLYTSQESERRRTAPPV
jgi:hypothetical protein